MDRAELMREVIIHLIATKAPHGAEHLIDPIRALPLPPQPPLDAEVAGVVERNDLAWAKGENVNNTSIVEALRLYNLNGILRERIPLGEAADLIERLARISESHRDARENLQRLYTETKTRAEKAEAEVARLQGELDMIYRMLPPDAPNVIAKRIATMRAAPKETNHD